MRDATTGSGVTASLSWALRMRRVVGVLLFGIASTLSLAATFEPDGQGRIWKAHYPDGSSVTFTYDGNGNRTSAVVTPDTTPPTDPSNLVASAASTSQINLTWTASTDAALAGYKIERCSGATCTSFAQIDTSEVASFSNTGLTQATTYRYRVLAYDARNQDSGYSNIAVAQTFSTADTTPPSIPADLNGSAPAHNRVNLSWDPSTDTGGSGVAGYRIYRDGSLLGSISATAYTDNTVSASATYAYRVAAYDAATPANVSAQSSPVNVTTPQAPDVTPPSVPTGLSALAPNSNLVTLSWTPSTDTGGSGLAGYRIYRNNTQIGTNTTNSYSDNQVSGSTAYSYKVAAYDSATPANVSALSAAKSITTPDTLKPSTPTGLAGLAASPTQVNLSWNAATDTGGSGLAGYRIYRNGSLLATRGTATTYSDTTATNNTTYSYKVAAYDNAGNTSSQSSAFGVTTPLAPPVAPTGITGPIENNSGSYTILWNAASGATRYELWESRLGSPYVKQHDGADTFKFFSGKSTGEYTYKAKACNAAGCSAYSSSHLVTVCRPHCL